MRIQGRSLARVNEQLLRIPEVARRLGLDGAIVYRLIADGELAAGKGRDGMVYVTVEALADFERRQAATAQ